MRKKPLTPAEQRDALLDIAVRHLRVYGYPDATRTNVLTVPVYRGLFDGMLRDTLADPELPLAARRLVEQLRSEIAAIDAHIPKRRESNVTTDATEKSLDRQPKRRPRGRE